MTRNSLCLFLREIASVCSYVNMEAGTQLNIGFADSRVQADSSRKAVAQINNY